MRTAFFIARKYFFSRQIRAFINILSLLSMVGVAVGAAALIIILSTFNGMAELIRNMHGLFDPDLKVAPRQGKSFVPDAPLLDSLENLPEVAHLSQVIEDNAILWYRDAQMIVKMKGVSENYLNHSDLGKALVTGEPELKSDTGRDRAILGQGLQYTLSLNPHSTRYALQVWYPKTRKSFSYSNQFRKQAIMPGGIFSIQKSYDEEYMFVPLDFARKVTGYQERLSYLEIECAEGATVAELESRLQAQLGNRFRILNSDEQHANLLRAIKVEKFFVYLIISFVLFLASFNIFSSLSMLALEKQKDTGILLAMGSPRPLIFRVFLLLGFFIALGGGLLGLGLGLGIVGLQQAFGLVEMGMSTAVVEAYPVKIYPQDLLFAFLTIVLLTVLAVLRPALKASKVSSLAAND